MAHNEEMLGVDKKVQLLNMFDNETIIQHLIKDEDKTIISIKKQGKT